MSTVTDIHRYPLAPPGEPEPLWRTVEWRKRVADHLTDSGWLCRASEMVAARRYAGTHSAHTLHEPVYVLQRNGLASVIRCQKPPRPSWRRRSVVEVVDLWREVRSWWDREAAVDRLVVRVQLSGGAVVDIARYGAEEWSLVGVVD